MSFLSVVVATYNREDTLKVTLDCLGRQTLAPDKYEVIVVDDGSPDHTEQMVREYMRNRMCPWQEALADYLKNWPIPKRKTGAS